MKLSLVSFVSVSPWSAIHSTRPLKLQPDVAFQTYDQYSQRCGEPSAASELAAKCAMPGSTMVVTVLSPGVDCPVDCCDAEAGDSGAENDRRQRKCFCTKTGKSYKTGNLNGTKHASRCCGNQLDNQAGVCECAPVGTEIQLGGNASDCCSGLWDSHTRKCIKRACTQAGLEATAQKPCCRAAGASGDQTSGKCPCVAHGTRVHPHDDAQASTCCSKAFEVSGGGVCGCISDPSIEIAADMDATNCCSQQKKTSDGKTYCVKPPCQAIGESSSEHPCCSGRDIQGVCVCVAAGKPVPSEGKAQCCSGQESDGKCAYVEVGGTVAREINVDEVCRSGSVDPQRRCSCIPSGGTAVNVTDCCSLMHDPSKGEHVCGCAPTGDSVGAGGSAVSCCSRRADQAGTCQCAPPGVKMPSLQAADCCGRTVSREGFCGCLDSNHDATVETQTSCCSRRVDSQTGKCACIPDNFAVAEYVHDDACCSGKVNIVDRICQPSQK